MHIIKLNAIDSTNSYLRQLCSKSRLEDMTTVMTKHQIKGRGQMGAQWNSEKGKNLTCSVFKRFEGFQVDQSFHVSMITSLAILRTLRAFQIPKLKIKWPNDILSENKKICGILIENIIKNNEVEASIIGIGLNVNQVYFDHLPQASSLIAIVGKLHDIDEIMHHLLKSIDFYFKKLDRGEFDRLKGAYERQLFRKNKPSTFKDNNGEVFPGIIQGVDPNGMLVVKLEDEVLRPFDLKEIQLLY